MISYKRDVLERQSLSEVKMGRGSPICERVRKKIVEYFKNNVPQRQIAKALQISSSSEHNIIKRFRETGEISVRKGQGRRPLLDACGLRALRRHWITHRHDSVIDITKWAQEYFQKPLSVNTIRRAICRCQLKLYHAKRKPYVNMVQKRRRVLWTKAHLKWTVSKWKTVLWSDESKFDIFVGSHGRRVLQAKEEGDPSDWVLNWPACSPDLSPIDNIWRIIKQKIHQRRTQTLQQLETYIRQEWDQIPTPTLHNLITSIPRRLQTVLKRRGYATPW